MKDGASTVMDHSDPANCSVYWLSIGFMNMTFQKERGRHKIRKHSNPTAYISREIETVNFLQLIDPEMN